mmetsp:Transcript_13726/g.30764  ORF Transcript_13726/g.30764 Transcript_13726/m.30764 type:complete len:206 (+) Transcript_13726:893-1510(+)
MSAGTGAGLVRIHGLCSHELCCHLFDAGTPWLGSTCCRPFCLWLFTCFIHWHIHRRSLDEVLRSEDPRHRYSLHECNWICSLGQCCGQQIDGGLLVLLRIWYWRQPRHSNTFRAARTGTGPHPRRGWLCPASDWGIRTSLGPSACHGALAPLSGRVERSGRRLAPACRRTSVCSLTARYVARSLASGVMALLSSALDQSAAMGKC